MVEAEGPGRGVICSVVFRYNSLTSQDPSSLDILSPFGMTAMTLE